VTSARKLIFPSSDGGPAPVTATEQLAEWQDLTGQPALVPTMPGGWHINAAAMSGESPAKAHLHIGWISGDQYFGVDQSRLPASRLARIVLGAGSARTGTATVNGQTWATWSDSHDDTVLLRTGDGQSTLVVSTLPASTATQITATLHQAPSSPSSKSSSSSSSSPG